MSQYIIAGGNKLRGKIQISGNKNEILPALAASLLTEKEVILRNVPQTVDVDVTLQIFQDLGVKISREANIVRLCAKDIKKTDLDIDLSAKLRASILFIAPLLARFGKVRFPHPGGCVIGKRSIQPHLEGLMKLGYKFGLKNDIHYGNKTNLKSTATTIFLEEPSVTATENLIMASVLTNQKTIIKNCAEEPHIVGLCMMLIKMGAKIEGVGSSTLIIEGVNKLEGVDYTIGPDYVEFGTYAIAAAVTGGEIELKGENLTDFEPVMIPLSKMGLKFNISDKSIIVSTQKIKSLKELKVNIWPGFPTDLMSAMIVLATQAKGVMLCHDWMYESRMFFVDKLITMGANITIADPHRVFISGPTKLRAKNLETPDLRAGMALVLASLCANGTSIINRAELIERGYENVVEKLTSIGASIKRIN